MTRSPPSDRETIARLRSEVDTLRLANAAVQEQMSVDAARTDVILRTMEAQATALQEANRRHAAQADFTRRVMDTTSAVMVVLDPDGRIRQVNHSFTLDLGIPETAAVGRAFDAFLMADERAILEQALPALPWPVHSPFYELVRIAGDYAAEHRMVDAQGTSRIYLLEASLQHDPRGKEEGAVVCATDITVLKTQQEALQRNARLLREAQRIAQLGHWDLDLANREMTASEEVVRILEVAEAPRGIAGWLALVHA